MSCRPPAFPPRLRSLSLVCAWTCGWERGGVRPAPSRCPARLGSWCLVFLEGLLCAWRWGDAPHVSTAESSPQPAGTAAVLLPV